MLKNPLVSFIVTSYNYEKFISRTLESIKNQAYKEFEIIIVDDCSSDNSAGVIERFIADNQDLRIILLRHDKNKGQLAAFQTGLRQAQGVFVSFIDSDDLILKDYAKTHIKVHMASSVAFTSSQIIEIDENDAVHSVYSVASPQNSANYEAKDLSELLDIDIDNVEFKVLNTKSAPFGGWFWSPNSSAMYRRSALDFLLEYDNTDQWKICPDKFLFNFANLIGGSAVIYAPLAAYRRHKGNAGNCAYVTGNKKYNNDAVTFVNLRNNLKIRPEAIRFIVKKRRFFEEKYGKKNTVKFLLTVLLSYYYLLKQFFS